MAPLHRAVALAQVDGVAVRVGKHLHFDVARLQHGALDQQLAIAKAGQRLRARAGQCLRQLRRIRHQPHAAPATAGHGLDHHRVADLGGLGGKACLGLVLARVAGQAGHALLGRQRLGRGLAAQRADGGGWRADPGQAGVLHRLGKTGVFAQKAIAGVHRVGAGGAGGGQQLVDAQIAVGRAVATQRTGQRGFAHVQGIRVGVGMHGHGLQAHAARRGDHAARDLAAVGDEDAFQVTLPGVSPCPWSWR